MYIIKSLIRALIFLILILNIVGCTSSSNKEENNSSYKENQKKNINKPLPNISYMGLRLNDESVSMNSNTIFNIQTEDQFTPYLEIKNGFDSIQKYRIIFLLNYKPITFLVNGEEHTFFDTSIDIDATKKINVTFPKLIEGRHDLTTIIIREPDRILIEPNFIPGFEHVLAHRSNIIVSTNEIKPSEFIEVDSQPVAISYNGGILLNQGPVIDLNNPSTLIKSININDIWISFENDSENNKYAVVILNILQIRSDVKYVYANESGIIKLPMELTEEIKYPANLVVLAVKNPFTTDNTRPYLSNKISIVD